MTAEEQERVEALARFLYERCPASRRGVHPPAPWRMIRSDDRRGWLDLAAAVRAEVEAEREERIVSTVEELEALPDGSVVRDGSPHRDVFEKAAGHRWMMTGETGLFSHAFIVLPARVIDVPASPAVEGAESNGD